MSSYLMKLNHVSSECRLRPEEELALLKGCICDPADPRFREKARYSDEEIFYKVYRVW